MQTTKLSDAEKNHSAVMNARPAEIDIKNENGIRVVFLGNSITLHREAPKIGWHHVWGMAASAEEKDYVHIVIREIEKRTGRKADVRIRNLAGFERDSAHFDDAANQDLVDFAPEILVVALGENVPELQTPEEQAAYGAAFRKLLDLFMQNGAHPKTVVRGVFWPNEWKDQQMREAAEACGATFVKAAFASDDSMRALGLFEHEGVQSHPGDKGMAAIAQCIITALFADSVSRCTE